VTDRDSILTSSTPRERRTAEHQVRRLEAFSDGVFAIAATLLVLDLSVNELGVVASDADLWVALVERLPTIIAFLVSFLLLCLLWWIHTRAFDDLERVDGVFVALNSLRLLGVVLIPFTTSISSTFGELPSSSVYLALDFCLVVVVGVGQAWYATDPRRGLMPALSDSERGSIRRGGMSAVILSIAAVVLSPLIGTLAFVVYALDPVLSRWLEARAVSDRP
jgi:uncharacterized membrane protein